MTLRDEVRQAVAAVGSPAPHAGGAGGAKGTTSDLTIDETLLLHSAGWEPVDLVYGISWWSIPWGVWQWTTGEVQEASTAFTGAVDHAAKQLRQSCEQSGGSGVLGVEVGVRVSSHHVSIELTGTAVRRTGADAHRFEFVSDLSARDFVLLTRAGWWPLGLAAGASFVIAPRRTAREWAAQQGQNVELPNLTQALYLARERAMERMQQSGTAMKAEGIVAVKLREGKASSSARVIQFVAIGTGVHLRTSTHRSVSPEMVVPLDEQVRVFDVKSLRSAASE